MIMLKCGDFMQCFNTKLELNDIDRLIQFAEQYYSMDIPSLIAKYTAALNSPDHFVRVLKTQADVILGYMHYYIIGDALTIDELVIAAKFRKRGYAELMIEYAEAYAEAQQCSYVNVVTLRDGINGINRAAKLLHSMSYLLQSTADRKLAGCPICSKYGYACKCIIEVYFKSLVV